MAIYRCHHCDQYIDDDWEPGEVDPDDDKELICPSCLEKYEIEYAKQAALEAQEMAADPAYQKWLMENNREHI